MPNDDRFRPGLLPQGPVLRRARGLIAAVTAFTAYLLAVGITDEAAARTDATVALFVVALAVLVQSARPLNLLRVGVVAAMALAFATVLVVPPLSQFFAMDIHAGSDLALALVAGGVGAALILAISPLIDRLRKP